MRKYCLQAYRGQTWGGLHKAWLAYIISKSLRNYDEINAVGIASFIQQLEGELGFQKRHFQN
jgi:hypothetical protein